MKTLKPPPFLQALHGKEPLLRDVALTYLVAIQIGIGSWIYCSHHLIALNNWETLIISLICADLAAGIFSNYTHATEAYYEDKPALRNIFIGLHVAYPALMLFILDTLTFRYLFPGIFTIAAAFYINAIRYKQDQKIVAVFVFIVGSGILLKTGIDTALLIWFYLMLMFKLILVFGIRRH